MNNVNMKDNKNGRQRAVGSGYALDENHLKSISKSLINERYKD